MAVAVVMAATVAPTVAVVADQPTLAATVAITVCRFLRGIRDLDRVRHVGTMGQ